MKIFLFLYPIEEYTKMYLLDNDRLYDDMDIKRPLPIMNECIKKRYRDNGYKIVFALYPDKKLYGLEKYEEDKIIYTDITFEEASMIDSNGNVKKDFISKYPSEEKLLKQLGDVKKLVVGGYHATDCVVRVASEALKSEINTLIDLDLTDFFFHLYKKEEYFNIEEYDPNKYKEYCISEAEKNGYLSDMEYFNKTFKSSAFGFTSENIEIKK